MKQGFMAAALGLISVNTLTYAEDPPGLVRDEEAPPARDGCARGGGRGQWNAPKFTEDRKWFHFLLDNRAKIRRTITRTTKGQEAITESDDHDVALLIQSHADVVSQFIENGHDKVRKNHAVPPRLE